MSYTTFDYSNLQSSAATCKDVDGLTVSVKVTNSGKMAGQEIVQLYVHDREAGLARPPKELKGFVRVALQSGETKTVTFSLDFRAFAFYHPGHQRWITEDGEFDILIGASAADIRCTQTITLQSTLTLPSLLDEESTGREWLADPRGKPVLEPVFQQVVAQMGGALGSDESGGIGMDMVEFMLDMPLLSVLHFQEGRLPITPAGGRPVEAGTGLGNRAAQK